MRKIFFILLLLLPVSVCGQMSASYFNLDYGNAANVGAVTTNGCRPWSTVSWDLVNTAASTYSWTVFDQFRSACSNNNVIFTMAGTPNFISSGASSSCSTAVGTPGGCYPPTDLGTTDATWKAFATALSQHWYAGDTTHKHFYELWNEINQDTTHPATSQMWSGTMAQMVTMACDAYTAIHANDPQAVVLSPSVTTDSRYLTSSPLGPANMIQQFFTAGGTNCVDGIAFHFYPQTLTLANSGTYSSNYAATSDPEMQIGYVAAIKAVISGAGKSYPIYCTEGSWGNIATLTTLQESSYMVKWELELLNAGVTQATWYAADSDYGGGTCNQVWGTLWISSGICPQGTAYTWFVGLVEGATSASGSSTKPCAQGGDDTWVCAFHLSNGRFGEFVWNIQQPKTITLDPAIGTCLNVDQSSCTITSHTVTIGANPILLEI